jgi:predicted ABC-type transport system involved in lysophospholipase L1 biosynthesis ATPase subunit
MDAGGTLVVVMHEERYLERLNLAAREIRMDEGRIVEQSFIART